MAKGTNMTEEEWEETIETRQRIVREIGQIAACAMPVGELDQRVREEHAKRKGKKS